MVVVIGMMVVKNIIMTAKPPAASNENARMYVLLVWANAKDAFLRSSLSSSSLLFLLFDIVQETLFANYDLRDWRLFYGTTLLSFDNYWSRNS
jgi:hypothetical protein